MNFIKQLGALAFGTRLRLLTDVFIQDGAKVYKSMNIDFEPRWFPVFYLLGQRAPLTITDITNELGYTQPAVTQIAELLLKKNLIRVVRHTADTRKKMLAISQKGTQMLTILQPIWQAFDEAISEMFRSTGFDILHITEMLESAMSQKSIYHRVSEKVKQKQIAEIKISDYAPELKKYFKDLNYQWLKKYFTIEKADRLMLNDFGDSIISKGGSIFFARLKDEIIGTCALIDRGKNIYELSKMAVDEKARGRQAGKKLALEAIARAKARNAKLLFLYTSPNLLPANNLYRKLGFVQTEFQARPVYKRPTIRMELKLN